MRIIRTVIKCTFASADQIIFFCFHFIDSLGSIKTCKHGKLTGHRYYLSFLFAYGKRSLLACCGATIDIILFEINPKWYAFYKEKPHKMTSSVSSLIFKLFTNILNSIKK